MKLRLKGESEWKDYKLYFNENGSINGVVYDEVKVKHPLASMNSKNETIEVSEPMLLPLECFDMWEEPNWQSVRTQAAIAAMQGVMNFFGSIDYNKETIAKLAVEQADALIKELRGASNSVIDKTIQKHPQDDLLNRQLTDFPLSVRSLNCLKANNIHTVRDLVKLNKIDWLKFRSSGKKSLNELDDFITEHNLSWGMNV